MGEEGIGEQEFLARALQFQAERRQLLGLFSCQAVFFFSKWRGQANDWDGSLNVAGAFDASVLLRRDAHGATGERPKGIDLAMSVCAECGAGHVLELLGHLLGEVIGPTVQQW